MKILCTIKRVVDPYAKVRPLSSGTGIDSGGAKFEINPFDEIAIEEALRLRDKHPGTEILVVSIGGSECEEQLRKALAMGADRALLMEASGELDSSGVAAILSEVVRAESPDLVLMGKQATDDDNNQAAQMLAARLDWPQATFASKVEIDGNTAHVTRETDEGEETLAFDLPGVITADLRLNEPRYIALPAIIKARSKPLDRRPAVAPPVKVKTTYYGAPAARNAGRKVETVDELFSILKQQGVLA